MPKSESHPRPKRERNTFPKGLCKHPLTWPTLHSKPGGFKLGKESRKRWLLKQDICLRVFCFDVILFNTKLFVSRFSRSCFVCVGFAMSGKIKSRSAANAESISGSVSCDERILRDCHQMYIDADSGECSGPNRRAVRQLPQAPLDNWALS